MNALFQFTAEAIEDLDDIWQFTAQGNRQAADRIEAVSYKQTLRKLHKA